MNFLGIDLSSASTGWCLLEEMGEGRFPRVTLGSFACRGDDFNENVDVLSDELDALFKDWRGRKLKIDLAGIEAPLRAMPKKKRVITDEFFASRTVEELASNPHTMLILPALQGAAYTMCRRYHIRTVAPKRMAPATWRKTCGVQTRAPAGTPEKDRAGWAKRETKMWASTIGLRAGFAIKNMDQSDAFGIACHVAIEGNSYEVRALLAGRKVAA